MTHESLPDASFSITDQTFIDAVEYDMRPMPRLLALDEEFRKNNRELYELIDAMAYTHSQQDPGLRGLYFSEFLLLAQAVYRIHDQDYFPTSWAENPPLLSI